MKTQQDYINLERQYAEAIGWTNIEQTGHSLLGKPPGGSPQSRDQAMLPQWARSWGACGSLIGKYNVSVEPYTEFCDAGCPGQSWREERHGEYTDYSDKDAAIRFAILSAALEQARAK